MSCEIANTKDPAVNLVFSLAQSTQKLPPFSQKDKIYSNIFILFISAFGHFGMKCYAFLCEFRFVFFLMVRCVYVASCTTLNNRLSFYANEVFVHCYDELQSRSSRKCNRSFISFLVNSLRPRKKQKKKKKFQFWVVTHI